jgi:cytochrome b subunit of formate dehydrogenase
MRKSVALALMGLLWLFASTQPVYAQVASNSSSPPSGMFRDQDTLPGSYRLYLQQLKELDWLWGVGPKIKELRKSSFATDAHQGVANYSTRQLCTDCHKVHTRDLHQSRAGVTCVQCHRDKPIAGIYHYYSTMNPIRRHAYVCAKCHDGATPSFASYVVHEPNPLNAESREEFPLFFYAIWIMLILAGGVFAFFIPYVGVWGLRELFDKIKGKLHKATSGLRIKRFTVTQRLWHFGLIILFMTMSVTGFVWMFIETEGGKWLAGLFGGYQNALWIHRTSGLIFLAGFAAHIVYLLAIVDWKRFPKSLLGPKTIVFQWADVKGFFQHFLWIFGLASAPQSDKWNWWEKFDYWAVWWGLIIVGITGLMLYDPVLTSDYMPGWLTNVALWVHRIEAVLAMGHIFTVHFFVEHFRPSAFPFGAAMFDGTLTMEHAQDEHPNWVARLQQEGKLDAATVPEPPVYLRILYFGVGYALIGLGLFLLIFALINVWALTIF